MRKQMTPKQSLFVDNYMVHFNASRAAKEAGYNTANPNRIGYYVLQSDVVKEEIKKRMDEKKEAMHLVPFDAIMHSLVEMAMDETASKNERMKAASLLINFKNNNTWGKGNDGKIDEYVNALQDQIGDVWGNE